MTKPKPEPLSDRYADGCDGAQVGHPVREPEPLSAEELKLDRTALHEGETESLFPIERWFATIAARDEEVERLREREYRNGDAVGFLWLAGYWRCDNPACNCDSWHGGHAEERLSELGRLLDTQGTTIRGAVEKLHDRVAELEKLLGVAADYIGRNVKESSGSIHIVHECRAAALRGEGEG